MSMSPEDREVLRHRIAHARATCTCLVVHPDHLREILDAYEKLLAVNLALLEKIYPRREREILVEGES